MERFRCSLAQPGIGEGWGVDDTHVKMTGMLVVSGVKIADFYFTCLGRENDIYTCKDIT